MYVCIFAIPLLINCWLVLANLSSVVEVSQQHSVCADFVEIGRWVEKKGYVSAMTRGKVNDLILLLVIVGESH